MMRVRNCGKRLIQSRILFLSIIGLLSISGCHKEDFQPIYNSDSQFDYKGNINVDGQVFRDSLGRQIILSGVNLVNKDKSVNYIGPEGEETFMNFKKWGFNVIRLGVIWDGVEPSPGVIDESYLSKIDNQIKMAGDYGLFVFLDMHQDLYSVRYGGRGPWMGNNRYGKTSIYRGCME